MTTQFYLTFECPHCNRLFEVPALDVEVFHDGMTVVCPRCEAGLEIRIFGNYGGCDRLELSDPGWPRGGAVRRVDWHGCYSNGWQNEIVSEAFSHPAKFARGLIRRIYEHAIREGWLAEGDTVLDPFGGVALGALDAMFYGLHWVGVELEEKFVDLGQQNIELWNNRYGNDMLPRWGTAVLLQGDSRQLCEVLDGARAQGIVASPPYASATAHPSIGSVNKDDWGSDGRDIVARRGLNADYGTDPANLGNMPEGEFEAQAVVSSPPWEATLGRDVVDKDARRRWAREHDISNAEFVSPIDMERIDCRDQEYGETTGQLGIAAGDTFWSVARLVVEQCYQFLVPSGCAIFVVKDFVRDKKRVPFCEQWRRMCEAVGFETVEEIRAWLVEDRGAQYALDGDLIENVIERKSFFRRLTERKGSPRIDWETVLYMRKAI